MMDTETVPKHVEFYSQNKFEKLVLLVGFIVRIFQITLQYSQSLIHASGIQTNQLHSPFETIISMQYFIHSTYLCHWLYV